ncbi:hypothetical protein GUITHDRAFT_69472 [Guillardia theta CCMP2712]|uniref:Uncharacterized protein n=1 Tax=Guillardia theta (strain CCMP2712) TaxID=905079 RepID=L1JHC8_GUITC|nr:hypothetical protein GUITHDRAFT_69472 [Guillardia theta CCMP2712]EKX47544.1 hypothetical protein GUITHDRAFT_69472 [Guillardia theta CCMP2712]|eukprot:XP_005834524.1 hypothetical protein GUITHDRAFT_69472 [Guillardia theta CCMP2712]
MKRLDASPPLRARYGHAAAFHSHSVWILGGFLAQTSPTSTDSSFSSDVWRVNLQSCSSPNALCLLPEQVTVKASWSSRYNHAAVSHRAALMVLGGQAEGGRSFNDVWQSSDGDLWTQVTASAAWSRRRSGHALVAFKDHLLVIGGRLEDAMISREVWVSADGSSWSQWSPPAGFVKITQFGAAVNNGTQLLMFGGRSFNEVENSFWVIE